MSGGGGSVPSGPTISQRLLALDQRIKKEEFEAEVAAIMKSALAAYNNRDVNAIQRHLETLRHALGNHIEGTVDLRFGGSIQKHTYIEGFSDIDALVILNKSELAEKSPDQVLDYFASRLRERLPLTKVERGTVAVTVHFSDGDIQLIPVLRAGETILVRDWTSNTWSACRPVEFTNRLTSLNKATGGSLIPVIKLAKSVVAGWPSSYRPTGYHIEALTVEIFSKYAGPMTTKRMLQHFFGKAADRIRKPIEDPTGQSSIIDDKLGPVGAVARNRASTAMERVAKRMRNADSACSVDEWRQILGVDNS